MFIQNVPLSEKMSWYPAITPPAGNKKEIFIAADFNQVDTHAINVSNIQLFLLARSIVCLRI